MKFAARAVALAAMVALGGLACDELGTALEEENTAPEAVAMSSGTVVAGSTVTLDGSSSSDLDGDTLTFTWTLLSTPSGSGAALSGASTAQATFEADALGVYAAELQVSDGKDTDADTVEVTATNTAPVASALPDSTVAVGSTVSLDGSGSMDSDGHSLTYSWTLEVPSSATATLSDPTAESPSFTADVTGDYRAILEVSDGWESATDTAEVSAIDPGAAPVINAVGTAGDIAYDVPHEVFVEATDPDGNALSYEWSLASGPGSLTFPDSADAELADSTNMQVDAVGSYQVEIAVSDGFNVTTDTLDFEAHDPVIDSDITTDRTLVTLLNSQYFVSRDIDVSAALTIMPGVVLEHGSAVRIDVLAAGGSLNADGTMSEPIVFTAEGETAGYWEGVIIRSNDTNNVLNYVEMSYAGEYPNDGNLELGDGARVVITNSTFTNSATAGIMANGDATLDFTNNVFTDNTGPALNIPAQLVGQMDSGSDYYDTAAPNEKAFINVRSATLTGDHSWPATDAPFRFQGGTEIQDGTVTIAAGADFLFDSAARLNVTSTGVLQAVGTASEPITMIGEGMTRGYWEGVVIQSNDANELTHVEVAYGGDYPNEGNVEVSSGARVTVTNSTFREGLDYGMVVYDGAALPNFAANTFSANGGPGLQIPAHLAGSLDTGSDYSNTDGTKGFVDVASAAVTTDQTWPNINAPYRFRGETTLEGATVTVAAGADFLFDSAARLTVTSTGALSAVGTSTDTITFEAEGKTPGYWEGILIQSNNTANELIYVDVAHAGDYPNTGNVDVRSGASVAVHHSTFSDSDDYGLYMHGGSSLQTGGTIASGFSNNAFYGNTNEGLRIPAHLVGSIDTATVYYDASDANGKSYVGVFATTVNTDQTWPATSAPIRFSDGDVDLDGAAVTVAAGANLLFAENTRIDVTATGSLTAVGTATNMITFLGEGSTPGAWEGIIVRSNDAANELDYVEVGYGGDYPNSGNIHLAAGQLTVTNSDIHDSADWGIYVDMGMLTESGNTYSNNASGGVSP